MVLVVSPLARPLPAPLKLMVAPWSTLAGAPATAVGVGVSGLGGLDGVKVRYATLLRPFSVSVTVRRKYTSVVAAVVVTENMLWSRTPTTNASVAFATPKESARSTSSHWYAKSAVVPPALRLPEPSSVTV